MSYVQLLALLTIICGTHLTLGRFVASNRILGGHNTTIEKRPYQVTLTKYGIFACGGSILNSRWILTAGHCVEGVTTLGVRAGSTYTNRGGLTFVSERFFQHPKFVPPDNLNFDVALIDLGDNAIPLNDETMKPVELVSSKRPAGTKVEISGWGYIGVGEYPDTLMEVETEILDHEICKAAKLVIPVTDTMVCTVPGYKNTCHGDSGGAMVLAGTNKQLGVVSFGAPSIYCNIPDYPAVFTDMSYPDIRNWIQSVTGV